jgi:SAM-dependent methyltransferase
MRKIGSINGSNGNLDGQPASGHEEYDGDNFAYKQELVGREGFNDMMGEKGFEPGAVAYEGDLPSNYPMARRLSAETADTWAGVLRPFLTTFYRPTVLDLGYGTGRFSTVISGRCGATVIGIDPSIAMLHTAVRHSEAGKVQYAAAQAERLRFAESSCDVAWMSEVVHHIRDRRACAAELHLWV